MFLHSMYSPVAEFTVRIEGDIAIGFAAPTKGGRPCLLKLTSDGEPISYARAVGHNIEADAKGLRSGWCGFKLHGLKSAFALSSQVLIDDAVSGERLQKLTAPTSLFDADPSAPVRMTVQTLIEHARADATTDRVALIHPFALLHLRRRGARSLLEATYQTLLKRWPEAGASLERQEGMSDEEVVETLLARVSTSEEYSTLWHGRVPGPFHPAFRYERHPLIA